MLCLPTCFKTLSTRVFTLQNNKNKLQLNNLLRKILKRNETHTLSNKIKNSTKKESPLDSRCHMTYCIIIFLSAYNFCHFLCNTYDTYKYFTFLSVLLFSIHVLITFIIIISFLVENLHFSLINRKILVHCSS